MKKQNAFPVVLAIAMAAMVVGAFGACENGTTTTPEPKPELFVHTYKSVSKSVTYILEVFMWRMPPGAEEPAARAREADGGPELPETYNPEAGDTYKLTLVYPDGATKTSTGTVSLGSMTTTSATWELSNGVNLKVIISKDGNLITISGTITTDPAPSDDPEQPPEAPESITAPGTVTPQEAGTPPVVSEASNDGGNNGGNNNGNNNDPGTSSPGGNSSPPPPAKTLTGITAAYTAGATIYPATPLDSLKGALVVKAKYSDSSETTLAEADYTLSGTLAEGTSTVTVSYTSGGVTKTTTFNVAVSATPAYGISLSKTGTHEFPAATFGYTTAPAALTVTVTNAGNQPTGALTITKTGTNAASFTLSKTTISDIAVGATATFTVAPTVGLAAGTYTATVEVTGSNSISADFNVSFEVEAATWGITLSANGSALTAHTFPAAIVGYTTAPTALSVTVINTGNQATGALTAAKTGTNAASFTLSKTSINSIAVDEDDDFTVTPNTSLVAGTYTATVTVSDGATSKISGVTFTVNFTVNKANPTVTWPTGLTATVGQTLAAISLPGNGTATPTGTFTWTTPTDDVGAAGTRTHNMTFTPTSDTANYNTLTQNVSITVNPKTNPAVTWPTGLTATVGQTLANVTLPGNGTANPTGTFEWTTPGASVGTAGPQSHNMTFTPSDSNYNTLTNDVTVTVNGITASYAQGATAVYANTPLDDLKAGLTVTEYSNGSSQTVSAANCTLTGPLTGNVNGGSSAVTVTYQSYTATFNVTVSPGMVLDGIVWAAYNMDTPSGTFASRPDMITQGYTSSANPSPSGWRKPSQAEFDALNALSSTWAAANTKGNAVQGRFYGPNHATASLPDNMAGAIFLPVNVTAANDGRYWSSESGIALGFNATSSVTNTGVNTDNSYPVRPVRNK